ncbi:thioredoxin domain-containing protein [Candidatus Pacearchaeota archaeon]|nr:thioredoxin domain-containing protein [Candidatus Pacearchaeota archaeon]
MKNLPLLVATIVGTLVLVVGVAVFFSAPEEAPVAADPSIVVGDRALAELNQEIEISGEEAMANVAIENDLDSDISNQAEVAERSTLVVFSDFQCPACKSLEESYLIRAREAYSGQIDLVYRHFPLDSIHPYARQAAWASEAAREEGKFWEYHDLLFENQSIWSSLTSKDDVRDAFIEYAVELDIDKDNFIEKMESDEIKERVNADVADANALRVNSTPTIYLNNNKTAPQDLSKQVEILLAE